jgi:hypothetical protein
MIRPTTLVFVMTAASCGGSSSGGTHEDAAKDAVKLDGSAAHPIDASVDVGEFDFGCGGDTACPLDKVCCAMPGPPFTFGCVAPATCQAADKIACDGPDECVGTNTPVCCGVDVPNGTGSFPQCGTTSVGTSCTTAAACPTHIGGTCSDTTKVEICHVSSECTDQTNNKCCTFMSGGATLTFCTDSLTAQVGGGVCHP